MTRNSLLLIDNPKGISSNAALSQIKRKLDIKKAGIIGILDPLATGMLPIVIGEATKLSRFMEDLKKNYRVKIKLGVKSNTGDNAIEAHNNYKNITHGAAITLGMVIASKLSFFEGHINNYQLDNIVNLIDSLGLNTDHSKYKFTQLKQYFSSDKKIKDGKLNLILIDKNFNAFITSKFNNKNISKAFN